MCESGIFLGGFLRNLQDTRIDLKITGNHRGLNAKQQGPSSTSRTGAGGGLWEFWSSAVPAAWASRAQTGGEGGRGERGELREALTGGGERRQRPDFGRRRSSEAAGDGAPSGGDAPTPRRSVERATWHGDARDGVGFVRRVMEAALDVEDRRRREVSTARSACRAASETQGD